MKGRRRKRKPLKYMLGVEEWGLEALRRLRLKYPLDEWLQNPTVDHATAIRAVIEEMHQEGLRFPDPQGEQP